MISSRGAITTNMAMVECASGQNSQGRDVFLLSELEKVWVAVSILVRRALLDGQNAQVPGLGSFWLEERCLVKDTLRYRQRYYVSRACFGVDRNFALRYGIDTAKTPLEREGVSYVKVRMADVVSICAVPAQTASLALREFIMYLGEGLYKGRTFHLVFPGVATLTIKRERFTLVADAELEAGLFERSTRRWPQEVREAGRERFEAERAPPSTVSSRPSTRATSRPSTAATSATAASTIGARPVFNAAAPKDRLFADIEKEAERKREAERARQLAAEEDARRQAALDCAIAHYNRYTVSDGEEGNGEHSHETNSHHREPARGAYRPATGESVYDWVAPSLREREEESARGGPSTVPQEPDVEIIEVTPVEGHEAAVTAAAAGGNSATSGEGRPLGRKDPQLEEVLRQEEPFSRPLSRRTAYEHASVRDLIYGPATSALQVRAPQRVDPNGDAIAVPPQHCTPATGEVPAPPLHGRKRRALFYGTSDTVGGLLKLQDE